MKRLIKNIAILLTGLPLLAGCTVGLGEAVDTVPPTISINYPPAASVIRDTFVISGDCNDDKQVASVSVSLRNTDTGRDYGTYNATVSGNKWSLELNRPTGEVTPWGIQKWQYPDGRYVAEVFATDGSKRTSGTSSVSFDIDNTPPLFIISSPGTLSITKASEYGTQLKVAGNIADDHTVSEMSIAIYDKNTITDIDAEGRPLASVDPYAVLSAANPVVTGRQKNVDTAGGTEIIFVNQKNRSADLLDDGKHYDDLYGSAVNQGTKSFWATITLEDSARKYTGSDTDAAAGGNKISSFYSNGTVYDSWFKSGVDLDAGKLKKIFNGTTAASQSVLDCFENNKQHFVTFAINPDADPKFSFLGYGFTTFDGSTSSSITKNKATGNQSAPVKLQCGRDGKLVKPETIRVYQFGPFAAQPTETEVIAMNNKSLAELEALATAGTVTKLFENSSYTSGAVENYNTDLHLSGGVTGGSYYILVAYAEDQEGNRATCENGYYGFTGYEADYPPKMKWFTVAEATSAGKTGTVDNNGVVNGSELKFYGTVDTQKAITELKYSVTVSDAETGTAIPAKSYTGDAIYTAPVGNGNITWNWNFTLPAVTENEVMYDYDIEVKVKNQQGLEDSLTRKIHIDRKKPVAGINSITPVVVVEDDSGNPVGWFLNGTVTFTGAITETYLEKVLLNIYTGDYPSATAVKVRTIDLGSRYNVNEDIDTTALVGDNGSIVDLSNNPKITFELEVIDQAGNSSKINSKTFNGDNFYVVDQATDKPDVKGSNFVLVTDPDNFSVDNDETNPSDIKGNLFTSSSKNQLMGEVTDDDGIKEISIKVKDSSGITHTTDIDPRGSTTRSFKAALPQETGIYDVTIIATDTTYDAGSSAAIKSNRRTEYGFKVAVDLEDPKVEETSVAAGASTFIKQGGSVVYTGKVSDDFKLAADNKLTVTYIKNGTPFSETIPVTTADGKNGTWTYTLVDDPGIADGTVSVTFTVTDLAGKTASVVRQMIKDTIAPVVELKNIAPVVVKTEGAAPSEVRKAYLNGVITVSGKVTEVNLKTDPTDKGSNAAKNNQYFDAVTLKVFIDKANPVLDGAGADTPDKTIYLGSVYSFEESIDTTVYAVDQIKVITVVAQARDIAGNVGEVSTTTFYAAEYPSDVSGAFQIDQTTDKPEISGSNFVYVESEANLAPENTVAGGVAKGNIFDKKGNNKLIASVADDDGVKEVYINVYKATGTLTAANLVSREKLHLAEGTTAGSVTYSIPDTIVSGAYRNVFEVVDITYDAVKAASGTAAEKAIQANRKTTYGPFWAAVDNANPSIKVENSTDKIYVRNYTQAEITAGKANVRFTGIAADDWELATGTPVVITYAQDMAIAASGDGSTVAGSVAVTSGTWAFDFDTTVLSEGTYTVTFTVTDRAGKTSSESRTIIKDVTGPVFGTSTNNVPGSSGYEANKVRPYIETNGLTVNGTTWYNSSSLKMVGGVSDNLSGIRKVEYKVDDAAYTECSGSESFFAIMSGLVNGSNIVIRAEDNAGNTTLYTNIASLNIDTVAPEGESINPTGTKLSNGNAAIVVNGIVTDDASGPDLTAGSIKIKVGSKITQGVTPDATATVTFNATNNSYEWTATIPTSALTTGGTVWAQIKDNAGNTSDINLFVLSLDNVPPTVKFADGIDGSTLNKIIKLNGSSEDNNGIESIKLEYKNGAGAWTEVENSTGDKVSGLTTWKLENIDTQTAFGTINNNSDAGTAISLRVTATDKAGNENSATVTVDNKPTAAITVNQHADRPIVTLTNLQNLSDMTSANPKFFESTRLYGTVVDDDGVAEFKIISKLVSDGNAMVAPTAAEWEAASLIPVNGGAFNYDFRNQGSQVVYFYVKDRSAEGTVFTSNAAHTGYSNYLGDVKIINEGTEISPVDGSSHDFENTFGDAANEDTRLFLKIDTVDPRLANTKYWTFSKTTNAYSDSWKDDFEDADTKFGGVTPRLKIQIEANDDNGIKTVKGYFEQSGKAGYKEYNFSYVGSNAATKNGEWIANDIYVDGSAANTNSLPDGTRSFTIVVTDNATRETTKTITFNVDNTAPTISIQGPDRTVTSSGDISVYGSSNDGTAKMYYAISPNGTVKPGALSGVTKYTTVVNNIDNANNTLIGGFDAASYVEYKQIMNAATTWTVYFDGDVDPSHAAIKTSNKRLNDYLLDYKVTTDLALNGGTVGGVQTKPTFVDIVKLYFWVKAVDSYGNESEQAYPIMLDPQGDRPVVKFSYPENNGDSLGGTVKVTGSAEDKNGQVKSAWIQIVSQANHATTWNTGASTSVVEYTTTDGIPTAASVLTKFTISTTDLDFLNTKGYEVYNMAKYAEATTDAARNACKWTGKVAYNEVDGSGNIIPHPAAPGSLKSGETAADYAILANLDGITWNYKINANGEFDPASGNTNHIAMRVFAIDNDNKVSNPVDRVVKFDADKPVFGSSQKFFIVQSASDTYGAANTASREYTENMYVKGEWYLIGSVEDPQGIGSLTIRNENTSTTHTLITTPQGQSAGKIQAVANNAQWNVKIGATSATTSSDSTPVFFKYKLPLPAESSEKVGKIELTITADDTASADHSITRAIIVNYDNKKPVIIDNTNAAFKISNNVCQSDNFYQFSSVVEEKVTDTGNNQSGFDMVVAYFTRTSGTGSTATLNYYDVFLPRKNKAGDTGVSANKVLLKTGSTNSANIVFSEGIYWKQQTVTLTGDNTFTLGTAEANIHNGGLVKIEGSIYKIKNGARQLVTSSTGAAADYTTTAGSTITIDGNLDYENRTAAQKSVTAYFAYGAVINHDIEESGQNLNWFGYYNSMSNDDGDGMVEYVKNEGGSYTWTANICSKNIPDGPIDIHYVAFDKAGNYREGVVAARSLNNGSVIPGAFVCNNMPRIAGVSYGTDDNGNGEVDASEIKTSFSGWYDKDSTSKLDGVTVNGKTASGKIVGSEGNEFQVPNGLTSSVLTIKGDTKVIPEIVGGNNGIGYRYSVTKNGAASAYYVSAAKQIDATDSITDDVRKTDGTHKGTPISLSMLEMFKAGSTGSQVDDAADQLFEFTLYDYTEGCGITTNASTKADSNVNLALTQYATMKMQMNVVLRDSDPAKAWFKPFFWKSATENSLYDNSKENGHIELEEDWARAYDALPAAVKTGLAAGIKDYDPKVSGKITLRGVARDNVIVNEIYIKIPGYNSSNAVLIAQRAASDVTRAATAGDVAAGLATTIGETITVTKRGDWVSTKTLAADGLEFALEKPEEFDQSIGNTVEFMIHWDTQKARAAGYVKTDVGLEASAKDRGQAVINAAKTAITYGTPAMSSNKITATLGADNKYTFGTTTSLTQTAWDGTNKVITNVYTPYYKVDVVPYVVSIITNLTAQKISNPSVFNRTALGHYPVQSVVSNAAAGKMNNTSSEGITLEGFNLSGTTIVLKGNDNSNITVTPTAPTATSMSKLAFNVAKLASGEFNATVDGVQIINNLNSNEAKGTASAAGTNNINMYNRQANGDTNNILTDDIIFDVWEFNDCAARPIMGLMGGLNMKINQQTGMLQYAFTNGSLWFSMGGKYNDNVEYSSRFWAGDYDTFQSVSVGFEVDAWGNTYGSCSGADSNSADDPAIDNYTMWISRWGIGYAGDRGSYGSGVDGVQNGVALEKLGQKLTATTFTTNKQRIKSPVYASSTSGTSTTNLYHAYYDAINDEVRFKAGSTSNASQRWSYKAHNREITPTGARANTVTISDANNIEVNDYVIWGSNKYKITGINNRRLTLQNYSAPNTNKITGVDVIQHKNDGNKYDFGQFVDQYCSDGGETSRVYNIDSCQVIAKGNTLTNRGAGSHVDIAVAKNASGQDVVVMVWYDAYVNKLRYSYKVNPTANLDGGDATARNWQGLTTIFAEGGEYCRIAVDAANHIHIAAYANGKVKYAYLDTYDATTTYSEDTNAVVVDASGSVGENLKLDVVLKDGKGVPYIGYYSGYKKAKMAYLSDTATADANSATWVPKPGVDSYERYTGAWEVSYIPSVSRLLINREDHINIGLWKNANGTIKNSTNGTSTWTNTIGNKNFNHTNHSKTYGNGTANPVLAYIIANGSESVLETAQMR